MLKLARALQLYCLCKKISFHNNAVLEYVMVDQAAENHDHYVIHDAGTEFLRGRLMIPGLSKSPHYVIQGLIRSDRSAIKT